MTQRIFVILAIFLAFAPVARADVSIGGAVGMGATIGGETIAGVTFLGRARGAAPVTKRDAVGLLLQATLSSFVSIGHQGSSSGTHFLLAPEGTHDFGGLDVHLYAGLGYERWHSKWSETQPGLSASAFDIAVGLGLSGSWWRVDIEGRRHLQPMDGASPSETPQLQTTFAFQWD